MNAVKWAGMLAATLLVTGCGSPPVGPPPPTPADVGALGRLEPGLKVHQIAAPSAFEPARIEKLYVEEGSVVRQGDRLADLDTLERREAAVREAKGQAAAAAARLALVRAGAKPEDIDAQAATVDQLRASLEHAEINLRRGIQLRRTRSISSEESDLLAMKAETARHAHRQAQATLAALKVIRKEDVALAAAEFLKAEAGVARAQAEARACRLTAPISGRVLKVHAREGERVGDKGVLELGDTSIMEAVAEVHEADLPLVRTGQRATVRLRGRAAAGELTGTVRHVGLLVGRRVVLDNDPVKDADARVVEVRIRLDSPSAVAGLSYAQVEVVIHTAGAP